MFCILSPVKIEELMKVDIPVKDKYGNADLDSFYSTNQGKEFSLLDPLRTYRFTSKIGVIDEIQKILGVGVVVYNCPLYVYVMSDNWYYKNLSGMHSVMFSHLYRMVEYQKRVNSFGFCDYRTQELRIKDEEMYYQGNFKLLESDIEKVMSVINLREQPLWSFYISKNEKFRRI